MTRTLRSDAVQQFFDGESGQDLIEYALIAALIGLGTIAALKSLTTGIGNVFGAVGSTLTTAV